MYIAGGALLPLLGWGIHITWTVQQIRQETKLLVLMHREPDRFGFGTGDTNKSLADSHTEMLQCINSNTQAIKTLVHFIKWLGEQQTGEKPPPEMP